MLHYINKASVQYLQTFIMKFFALNNP